VTVRGATTDPDGRRVELTDERWSHISERHPEVKPYEDAILRAVGQPDRRVPGSRQKTST